MFVLGGSLCPPAVRARAVPLLRASSWADKGAGVLVLESCTDHLLHELQENGCYVTVAEPPAHYHEAVRLWNGRRRVRVVETNTVLSGRDNRTFDVIFLLGGFIHTGGSSSLWSEEGDYSFQARRQEWLLSLQSQLANGGIIVVDKCDDLTSVVRSVACSRQDSGTTLVEACHLSSQSRDYARLMLRTELFNPDGVLIEERVRFSPWVPVDEAALEHIDTVDHEPALKR
jgi:hypothetical protein